MGADEQERDKRPEGEATVLPAREVMSLITSDPSGDFTPGMGAPDAHDFSSGGERVTSEDRDEHFSGSDSASPQT